MYKMVKQAIIIFGALIPAAMGLMLMGNETKTTEVKSVNGTKVVTEDSTEENKGFQSVDLGVKPDSELKRSKSEPTFPETGFNLDRRETSTVELAATKLPAVEATAAQSDRLRQDEAPLENQAVEPLQLKPSTPGLKLTRPRLNLNRKSTVVMEDSTEDKKEFQSVDLGVEPEPSMDLLGLKPSKQEKAATPSIDLLKPSNRKPIVFGNGFNLDRRETVVMDDSNEENNAHTQKFETISSSDDNPWFQEVSLTMAPAKVWSKDELYDNWMKEHSGDVYYPNPIDFTKKHDHVTVVFVCWMNTCRSPMAHYYFQALIKSKGLAEKVTVKSGGLWEDADSEYRNPASEGTIELFEKLVDVPGTDDEQKQIFKEVRDDLKNHLSNPLPENKAEESTYYLAVQKDILTMFAPSDAIFACGPELPKTTLKRPLILDADVSDPAGMAADGLHGRYGKAFKSMKDHLDTLADIIAKQVS